MSYNFTGSKNHQLVPNLKGKRVRLQKGATLVSMSPNKKGPYKTTRAQTITVNHQMSGWTNTVGYIFADGERYFAVRIKDIAQDLIRWGYVGSPYNHTSDQVLDWILASPRCELVPVGKDGDFDINFHVRDPMVVWPGSGCYWVEASINDVTVIED